MIKMHSRHKANKGTALKETRIGFNDLLDKHAPIQISSADLRLAKAKAKARRKASTLLPYNNHTQLIVNVIYNSLDETKEYGIFAIDVVTGELTCLVPDFEGLENDGFNGGGHTSSATTNNN